MSTPSTTKAVLATMSLNDLLGAPIAPVVRAPRTSNKGMSPEELKAKRNEAQRALRSTPEGKAYANAASKKSIALKKAKLAAELETLKALVATIVPPTTDVDGVSAAALEEALTPIETPTEETLIETPNKAAAKKASTKGSKKKVVVTE